MCFIVSLLEETSLLIESQISYALTTILCLARSRVPFEMSSTVDFSFEVWCDGVIGIKVECLRKLMVSLRRPTGHTESGFDASKVMTLALKIKCDLTTPKNFKMMNWKLYWIEVRAKR